MVVRVHNVAKWRKLLPGQVLSLPGEQSRKVRIELNCPAPTRLDLVRGDADPVFLAIVQGMEAVEFSAGETVELVCTSEDEVWYFTNDGDQVGVENIEAVSFTKIANRRARNPELERMLFKMEQNVNRRLAHLEAENNALRRAQPSHDPETGEVDETPVGDGASAGSAEAPKGKAGGAAATPPEGAAGDAGAGG